MSSSEPTRIDAPTGIPHEEPVAETATPLAAASPIPMKIFTTVHGRHRFDPVYSGRFHRDNVA